MKGNSESKRAYFTTNIQPVKCKIRFLALAIPHSTQNIKCIAFVTNLISKKMNFSQDGSFYRNSRGDVEHCIAGDEHGALGV